LPLSWVWGAAVARRNRRFDSATAIVVPGLTVVSVGNLAVGGTGKTPLASWVARRYAATGRPTALLTSGYGPDEARLHARWTPEVAVVADRDRVEAARKAANGGSTLAVLDDGFQHRRIRRDLDVVLLAAEDAFPGPLLPRGPYREPPSALRRAHAVVVTRRTASASAAQELAARVGEDFPGLVAAVAALQGGRWLDLDDTPVDAPSGDVVALTAIARPEAFRRTLSRLGVGHVDLVAFPDHHDFSVRDAREARARAGTRPLLVTEKDAVKLVAHRVLLGDVRVLCQDVRFEAGEEALRALLDSVLGAEVS
jgi:tetraacyldisaccharide 4'-kinase